MDTTGRPGGSVVVGVDGSEYAEQALLWAAEEAWLERRPLLVVHADDPVTPVASGGAELLRSAVDHTRSVYPALEIHSRLVRADPRTALIDLAAESSMLVLGSRGRGHARSLLPGSTSVALSRHARCPVTVVRPHSPAAVRRGVLVGTDATEKSRSTLELGYLQASMRRLPLTVAHCVWDYEAASVGWTIPEDESDLPAVRLALDDTVAELKEKFPEVPVEIVIGHGRTEQFLVDQAATMHLVVVGHHGWSALRQWGLGSLATAVVGHAASVVLVVP
jgi:nucleotide-binding universal stress UspA family protein